MQDFLQLYEHCLQMGPPVPPQNFNYSNQSSRLRQFNTEEDIPLNAYHFNPRSPDNNYQYFHSPIQENTIEDSKQSNFVTEGVNLDHIEQGKGRGSIFKFFFFFF